MSRPTDWYVLDLPGDPVPGDPSTISDVARRWSQVADDADSARSQITSLLGDQAVMQWIGKGGDAFRSHSSKLPGQLQKCSDSYRQAAHALSAWSGQLDGHQRSADHALVLGRAARDDLHAAQSRLSSAQGNASSAQSAVDGYSATARQAAHDTSVPAPDPAQVRAATSRAAAAQQAVSQAQQAVGDAQARLDAAKRLAAQAAQARDHDGHTTATRLHDAADAGIPPDSFWHKLGDALGAAWHVLVEIAKVVVVIGGIIALVIGGPIAWVVFAAAMVVLADTLVKYAQGKATLWDVALAAISCIPCTKGLTTLAELSDAFKAGGLMGAGAHLLASGKSAAIGFLRTAQRLRVGLLPATTALFHDAGDVLEAAKAGSGWSRFTAAYQELNGIRTSATNAAWARYIEQVGETDPARAASLWQGHGSYPGVDAWDNRTLGDGTVLEGAYPGLSGYTVPEGTFGSLGDDAARYNQGVQVGPSTNPRYTPYRPEAVRVQLNGDLDVASSKALANPQYGAGGLPQYYIPGFDSKLISGQVQIIDSSGHVVPVVENPITHRAEYTLPDSAKIHLVNFDTMPSLPSLHPRPVLHQTGSRLVGSGWTAGQIGPR